MEKLYYQYELNEEGIVIAIHSSKKPFSERQLTLEQLKLIKLGETKF